MTDSTIAPEYASLHDWFFDPRAERRTIQLRLIAEEGRVLAIARSAYLNDERHEEVYNLDSGVGDTISGAMGNLSQGFGALRQIVHDNLLNMGLSEVLYSDEELSERGIILAAHPTNVAD